MKLDSWTYDIRVRKHDDIDSATAHVLKAEREHFTGTTELVSRRVTPHFYIFTLRRER